MDLRIGKHNDFILPITIFVQRCNIIDRLATRQIKGKQPVLHITAAIPLEGINPITIVGQ